MTGPKESRGRLNHIRHRLASLFAHHVASTDSAPGKGLFDTSFLTVLLGAYIFLVGWSFAYVYYDALGIPVAALSIPVQQYYLYALTVLLNTPVVMWLVLIALVTSAYLATMFRPPLNLLVAPLLVALLVVCYYNARDRAGKVIEPLRSGRLVLYPSVALFLKKDAANEMPEELKGANERGELRLITHTSDHVFVLWQPPPDKQLPAERRGYTFQIPQESLHGHRVQILDERRDATKR
jgi:hypothetical protein